MNFYFRVFILFHLLLYSTFTMAMTTGDITGTVSDREGNGIPGVTVMIVQSAPASLGDAITDDLGRFRFPVIPAGVYTVRTEIQGMAPAEVKDVRVSTGQGIEISFVLQMESYLCDLTGNLQQGIVQKKHSSAVMVTVERAFTERLPDSGSLQPAFAMSGGSTGSGNVRIHGSSHTDNVYFIDGVNVTDPITSHFGTGFNVDAVEEVVIQTGGFSAEYGGGIGGILNTVTRTPDNEYHFILREQYMDSSWHDSPDHGQMYSDDEYWDSTLTVWGPILKDRLWGLISVNYFNNDATKTRGEYSVNADEEYFLPYIKLNGFLSPNHQLTFFYQGEEFIQHGIGDLAYQAPETFMKIEYGGPFYGINYTWLAGSDFVLNARGSVYSGFYNNIPENDTGLPSFYDLYSGYHYGNAQSSSEEERERYQFNIDGQYFMADLMGSHEIKVGFLKTYQERTNTYNIPGGAHYVIKYYDRTYGNRYISMCDLDPTISNSAASAGHYVAAYIQDDWSVMENLTFNLGVRYERSWFKNNDGDSAVPAWQWGQWKAEDYFTIDPNGERHYEKSDMAFENLISPRIGIAWDIFNDGCFTASAFWGRYYNPYDLQLPDLFQPYGADVYSTVQQSYSGPAWSDNDGDGIPDDDFFYSDNNWYSYGMTEPPGPDLIDHDLEPEYTDEFTSGLFWQIMDSVTLEYRFTDRKTRNLIEDVGLFFDDNGNVTWTYRGGINWDDPANPFFAGDSDPFYDRDPLFDPKYNQDPNMDNDYYEHRYWVTNPDGAKRDYQGHEITGSFKSDHFDIRGSYTYSRARGTLIDASDTGGAIITDVVQFGAQYDTWATSQNLYGELPWSARHYFKLHAAAYYTFWDVWEISLGLNGFLRSGYRYSRVAYPPDTYDPYRGDDPDDRSTWTGDPPYHSCRWYFTDGRGGEKLPSVNIWDISFQNTIHTAKWWGKTGASITIIGDIFNVMDNQVIISENSNYNSKSFGQADAWAPPRSYSLTLKIAM